MDTKRYRVRYFRSYTFTASMLILLGLSVYNTYGSFRKYEQHGGLIVLGLVNLALLVVIVISLVVVILLLFKKPFELEIGSDYLLVNKIKVSASDMKGIYIRGYFYPLFGIKLKGKIAVSSALCFSLLLTEQDLVFMQDLRAWADRNEITLKRGSFTLWI